MSISIRKVAVLGAGVMGAQIAAHLANCGFPVCLFDLADKGKDKSAIAKAAIKNLAKLKPAPLADKNIAARIQPANYDEHLECLKECDWVIEVIGEQLKWKQDLYSKIAPHINDNALLTSNTSGLSLTTLSESLPEKIRPRFFGTHFFNPPRYLQLVELIPHPTTDMKLVEELEAVVVTNLGKSVVHAKDTPNFVANRVGVFSMLATMHHAERLDIPFEVVDALTGPIIGRPKSATFRTADVVGLDTMGHVIGTMAEQLQDDPWASFYKESEVLKQLIAKGALGQKTRAGFFKKVGKEIHAFDVKSGDYRPADQKADAKVIEALKIKNVQERFAALRDLEHPQAQFVWACFRDVFHYIAVHAKDICHNVRDIDLAMRWGFGWAQGPFETWQSADWAFIRTCLQEEIKADKTMCNAPLPKWIEKQKGVYSEQGALSTETEKFEKRFQEAVYQRQCFPEAVLGESFDEGKTLMETDAVRLWELGGDGIGILSFKTKANCVSQDVLHGIMDAIDFAEQNCKALVLWQRNGSAFSVGANLMEFVETLKKGDLNELEAAVALFQKASMRLKYSPIPTVVGVRGYVFGGGCELMLHCDRIVAAFESYIGLVEVGVGLLPAGGGCKEFARRAAQNTSKANLWHAVETPYKQIAMGSVAGSAVQAQNMGYLRDSDVIVPNVNEVLYVAKQQAKALAESGYRPPVQEMFMVIGKQGVANADMMLVNMHKGGFISEYDNFIGHRVAEVLCGGEVEAGSMVDEEWLLRLERKKFVELASQKNSQDRIEHMLKTRKPLRN